MWSQDDETGALIESSSSQLQLLEAGGPQLSGAHAMVAPGQMALAAVSAASEMTFALDGAPGRNIKHNFAATVGPSAGAGNQSVLLMAPGREETAALANLDLEEMLREPREVPPAGGMRYGASFGSQNASDAGQPDYVYAPRSTQRSSLQGAHGQGKYGPGRAEDNIIRVARANN